MNAVAVAVALAVMNLPAPAADANDPVRNGLKWLAARQKADGTWDSRNGFAPTTTTATAGLALLMQGSTPKEGLYAPHIRKTIAWLEANTGDNGLLASNTPNEAYQGVYGHTHALLFLACAHDADDDADRRARVAKVLAKAVAYLVGQQTARGGWSQAAARENGGFDDSQSTAAALQALLAARKAGAEVPKAATDRAFAYLTKATNKQGGVIYTLSGGALPRGNDGQPQVSAMAAVAALGHDGARPEVLRGWVATGVGSNAAQRLQNVRAGGVYPLSDQLHIARTAFGLGEIGHRKLDPDARDGALVRWSAVRAPLFKELHKLQAKNGSWPDPNIGPEYATAVALLILQLDNDYLPAFAR